jgi:hypothetical protein
LKWSSQSYPMTDFVRKSRLPEFWSPRTSQHFPTYSFPISCASVYTAGCATQMAVPTLLLPEAMSTVQVVKQLGHFSVNEEPAFGNTSLLPGLGMGQASMGNQSRLQSKPKVPRSQDYWKFRGSCPAGQGLTLHHRFQLRCTLSGTTSGKAVVIVSGNCRLWKLNQAIAECFNAVVAETSHHLVCRRA